MPPVDSALLSWYVSSSKRLIKSNIRGFILIYHQKIFCRNHILLAYDGIHCLVVKYFKIRSGKNCIETIWCNCVKNVHSGQSDGKIKLRKNNHKKSLKDNVLRENWCRWWESDSRPHPYQGCALPLSHSGKNDVILLFNFKALVKLFLYDMPFLNDNSLCIRHIF